MDAIFNRVAKASISKRHLNKVLKELKEKVMLILGGKTILRHYNNKCKQSTEAVRFEGQRGGQ